MVFEFSLVFALAVVTLGMVPPAEAGPSPILSYTTKVVTDLLTPRVPGALDKLGSILNCTTKTGAPCQVLVSITDTPTTSQTLNLRNTRSDLFDTVTPGNLKIQVYGSLTQQSPVEINVPLVGAKMIYSQSSGAVKMKFSDAQGSVEIMGIVTGQHLAALLSYENTVSSDSTSKPAAASLGQFTADLCSIFSCIKASTP